MGTWVRFIILCLKICGVRGYVKCNQLKSVVRTLLIKRNPGTAAEADTPPTHTKGNWKAHVKAQGDEFLLFLIAMAAALVKQRELFLIASLAFLSISSVRLSGDKMSRKKSAGLKDSGQR